MSNTFLERAFKKNFYYKKTLLKIFCPTILTKSFKNLYFLNILKLKNFNFHKHFEFLHSHKFCEKT